MNIAYYQNMLVKEFCSVINDSSDPEITVGSEQIKPQTITKIQAVKNLFEIGLDMNLFLHTEDYNTNKITPLIEYATSNTDDFNILKLCFEHVSTEFFTHLTYEKQCDIVGEVISKNMKIENKNFLIEDLFDKGFSFKQKDSNSRELDWIDYGYTEFVEATVKKQPTFNWNHVYNSPYGDDESITILEKIIIAIEDANVSTVSTESKYKTLKIANLQHMKEQVEKLSVYQSLDNDLNEKTTSTQKIKI